MAPAGICVVALRDGHCPVSGDCQTDQFRKRLGTSPLHDRSAVIFDSALADAQISSNVLARLTGENQFHDLALSNGQAREALLCGIVQSEQPEEQFFLFSKNMAFRALRSVADIVQDWSVDGAFKCSGRN